MCPVSFDAWSRSVVSESVFLHSRQTLGGTCLKTREWTP